MNAGVVDERRRLEARVEVDDRPRRTAPRRRARRRRRARCARRRATSVDRRRRPAAAGARAPSRRARRRARRRPASSRAGWRRRSAAACIAPPPRCSARIGADAGATASSTWPMRRTYSKNRRVGSCGSTCDCAVPSTSSVSPDGEKMSASNSIRGWAMPASSHVARRPTRSDGASEASVEPESAERRAGYTGVPRTNQESTGHGASMRHMVDLCAPRPTLPSYCGRLLRAGIPDLRASALRLRGTTLRYRQ